MAPVSTRPLPTLRDGCWNFWPLSAIQEICRLSKKRFASSKKLKHRLAPGKDAGGSILFMEPGASSPDSIQSDTTGQWPVPLKRHLVGLCRCKIPTVASGKVVTLTSKKITFPSPSPPPPKPLGD